MIFKYRAYDDKNKILENCIEANSEKEVLEFIRQNNLSPIKIYKLNSVDKPVKSSKKFKDIDLHNFYFEMNILLSAGITAPNAIKVVKDNYKGIKNKLFNKLYKDLLEAKDLSQAMKESGNFSIFDINLIKVGESSSNMESVFNNLSIYYQNKYRFNKKLKNALTYPIFLLITTLIVVNFLVLNILPTFSDVFINAGDKLPLVTRILINTANFINGNILYILIILLVIIFLFKIYISSEYGSFKLDKFKLSNRFYKLLETKRFLDMFSFLLKSNVTVSKSLEIINESTRNKAIKNDLTKVIEELYKGMSFSKAVEEMKIFPELVISLFYIGETSSSLNEVIESLSNYYEHEIEVVSGKYIALIEPIAILILSFFVGFIVISIAFPMFDLINKI